MEKREIQEALARGYYTKRHEKKVLDPDLIEDMAMEVLKGELCEVMSEEEMVEILWKQGLCKMTYIKEIKGIRPHNLWSVEYTYGTQSSTSCSFS